MHGIKIIAVLLAGLFFSMVFAGDPGAVPSEKTDVISRSAGSGKQKWMPFKVCVLDFTTLDIEGQKRFLDLENKPIAVPVQNSLNTGDRLFMNSIMQGFVRLIDVWDNTSANRTNRELQLEDNRFEREKALSLYQTIVKGKARPVVIGADYLTAYLGRYHGVFGCVESSVMASAMQKLQASADFPKDFMLRLARETGATHLIYGTVSDMRVQSKSFKGYGIETKSLLYQLDVIIKMVDLAAQHTVYSNVYTGSYREQRPVSTGLIDHDIFQNLMKSALEQAAEDLYDHCRPGRKNKITVTPMPYVVNVVLSGGMFFKAEKADIFVDGVRVGNGGSSFLVPAGKHTLKIQCPGYKEKLFDVQIAGDQTLNITLEK